MTLQIERFQPEGMNVRMSAGQPSYSHVVTVSGTGKLVFIAGQLARDIDGNCVGKGDMRAQMEQTFQNLDRCLKAPGQGFQEPARFFVAITIVFAVFGEQVLVFPNGNFVFAPVTTQSPAGESLAGIPLALT